MPIAEFKVIDQCPECGALPPEFCPDKHFMECRECGYIALKRELAPREPVRKKVNEFGKTKRWK